MLARAPASPARGLHHHAWYFNFTYFCTMCGLERRGLVDQNWLERNLSALLLRTLVEQSESIKEDNLGWPVISCVRVLDLGST